jgi:hypothetical protein
VEAEEQVLQLVAGVVEQPLVRRRRQHGQAASLPGNKTHTHNVIWSLIRPPSVSSGNTNKKTLGYCAFSNSAPKLIIL